MEILATLPNRQSPYEVLLIFGKLVNYQYKSMIEPSIVKEEKLISHGSLKSWQVLKLCGALQYYGRRSWHEK